MTFHDLALTAPLQRAVEAIGYDTPTPIQQQAIPAVLAGRDLLGCAQTGTGKTAAFALPLIQLLDSSPAPRGRRPVRALILTPTRELAIQIDACCRDYARFTRIRHTVIFGGVSQRPQVEALQQGVDLLVATPGRLLDLLGQGCLTLDAVRHFVLDEADRMLDMGFIQDIKRLLPLLPRQKQTLLFSATMPADIAALAEQLLHDPVHVTVTPPASVVETIRQEVYFVEKPDKSALLAELLRRAPERSTLVFARTKHGADRIARTLTRSGIPARAIHGDKSQGARQKALGDFKSGELHVLIATDIAARGIDISELPLVVNYDLPEVPETYVHRIGRTGRAGCEGCALSFCSEEQRPLLRDIERTIGRAIPHAEPLAGFEPTAEPAPAPEPYQPAPAKGPAAKGSGSPAKAAGAAPAKAVAKGPTPTAKAVAGGGRPVPAASARRAERPAAAAPHASDAQQQSGTRSDARRSRRHRTETHAAPAATAATDPSAHAAHPAHTTAKSQHAAASPRHARQERQERQERHVHPEHQERPSAERPARHRSHRRPAKR